MCLNLQQGFGEDFLSHFPVSRWNIENYESQMSIDDSVLATGVSGLLNLNGVSSMYRISMDATMNKYWEDVTHCSIVVTMDKSFDLNKRYLEYRQRNLMTPIMSSNSRLHIQFGVKGIKKCEPKLDGHTRYFSSPILAVSVSVHMFCLQEMQDNVLCLSGSIVCWMSSHEFLLQMDIIQASQTCRCCKLQIEFRRKIFESYARV